MKLVTLFLTFFLVSQTAFAAPYYRFWRGYKRTNHVKAEVVDGKKTFVDDPASPMSWEDFEKLVNQWLIPATTSCCAETSLIAYLPVMMPKGKKSSGVHDEIAMIVYRSEEAYKKTRETVHEAQVYGPLHGDVFAMGNTKAEKKEDREKSSRSLVPVKYAGAIDLTPKEDNFFLPEVAYDVIGSDVDWQEGHTIFRISSIDVQQDSTEKLNRYLKDMRGATDLTGLQGYVVLITETYMIEYLNWQDKTTWSDFLKSRLDKDFKRNIAFKSSLEIPARPLNQVEGDPLRYEYLSFARAATVRFDVGRKPDPGAKHPRLD